MSGSSFRETLARLDARINWERRDRTKGWRVDLDPIRDLLERLERPDRAFRVIHVTGSKGKGSVASLIAGAIGAAGYRVGVYGSPHVESITERVRIDGSPIDEEGFGAATAHVLDELERAESDGAPSAEASWFDIVTAAALVALRDAGVDWAVLEVGLGGRLDSTNAIDAPEVAVIASIALEHTQILGDTHAAIALEKAGIVKPGCHFVSGSDPASEAGRALAIVARREDVAHRVAWDPADATFEARNARVARAALDALGERDVRSADGAEVAGGGWLTPEVIVAARLPGRMEQRTSGGTPVVLDGAHVEESIRLALAEGAALHGGLPVIVLAIHREKDADSLLRPFAAEADSVVATTVPESGVHRPVGDVAGAAARLGLEARAEPDPRVALRRAVERARDISGWVLVTGSLYLVGAVRSELDPRFDPRFDPSADPCPTRIGKESPPGAL